MIAKFIFIFTIHVAIAFKTEVKEIKNSNGILNSNFDYYQRVVHCLSIQKSIKFYASIREKNGLENQIRLFCNHKKAVFVITKKLFLSSQKSCFCHISSKYEVILFQNPHILTHFDKSCIDWNPFFCIQRRFFWIFWSKVTSDLRPKFGQNFFIIKVKSNFNQKLPSNWAPDENFFVCPNHKWIRNFVSDLICTLFYREIHFSLFVDDTTKRAKIKNTNSIVTPKIEKGAPLGSRVTWKSKRVIFLRITFYGLHAANNQNSNLSPHSNFRTLY